MVFGNGIIRLAKGWNMIARARFFQVHGIAKPYHNRSSVASTLVQISVNGTQEELRSIRSLAQAQHFTGARIEKGIQHG